MLLHQAETGIVELILALILYAGALLSHETAILFGVIIAAYVFSV